MTTAVEPAASSRRGWRDSLGFGNPSSVEQDTVRLADATIGRTSHIPHQLVICQGEVVLEMEDALVIVVVRRGTAVVDDQRAGNAQGLHPNVGMVKVYARIIVFGCDLVIEKMFGRNGPLGC